jgi:hypothetical protein
MVLLTVVALIQAQTFSPPPLVPSVPQREPSTVSRPPLVGGDAPPPTTPPTHRAADAETQTRRLYELAIPGAVGAFIGWFAGWGVFFDSVHCSGSLFSSAPGAGYHCSSASGWLFIPQIGPWLAFIDSNTSNHLAPTLGVALMQTLSLAAMIAGFAIRVPVASSTESISLNVMPTSNGAAVSGRF